jgi:hypothetical protein
MRERLVNFLNPKKNKNSRKKPRLVAKTNKYCWYV